MVKTLGLPQGAAAGDRLILSAGRAGTGPYERLHWRWPSLVLLADGLSR